MLETTVPLRQLCRTVIRQQLSDEMQNEVELLPTATTLKKVYSYTRIKTIFN